MVCLLNSCLYVMFRSCFESLESVVTIKLVRAAHCGAPRIAAHRTYMGSCRKKNDWQFSNPRIDTVSGFVTYWQALQNQRWDTVSILAFENCQSFFSYNCPCTYGVPQCAAHRNGRRAPVWLAQHLPNSPNNCGTSHTDNCLINTPYCHACF